MTRKNLLQCAVAFSAAAIISGASAAEKEAGAVAYRQMSSVGCWTYTTLGCSGGTNYPINGAVENNGAANSCLFVSCGYTDDDRFTTQSTQYIYADVYNANTYTVLANACMHDNGGTANVCNATWSSTSSSGWTGISVSPSTWQSSSYVGWYAYLLVELPGGGSELNGFTIEN